MIVKECFTRYYWVYVLQRNSDAVDASRKFSADVRADDVPSEVDMVRSDNRGEFVGEDFGDICRQYFFEHEFSNEKSPLF